MAGEFVFDPSKVNFGNLYQPGTFGGDSYWNSIFGGLGIDTSKPAPSVTEFVPAPPPPPPPPPPPSLEQQLADYWNKAGINYNIKGTNRAAELAEILQRNQIQSLADLGKFSVKQTPYEESGYGSSGEGDPGSYYTVTRNRAQLSRDGQLLGRLPGVGKDEVTPLDFLPEAAANRFTLASSSAGKRGGVNYDLIIDDKGNIQGLVPQWEASDNFAGLLPVLSILAMPFTGGLSAALGGGLAGTIGANALIQGGLGGLAAEASGGDFLSGFGKGALTGGITGGISSLAAPFANTIGADVLSSTGSQAFADIASGAVKGAAGSLPSALISGDASNLLTGAFAGGVGGGTKNVFSDLPESIRAPVTAAVTSGLLGRDPTEAAIRAFAGDLMKSGPTMPGAGTSEDIQEGFFEPGGPGFMPTEFLDDAEVQRELQSLLGRYPAPPPPSDWFLGENIMSGVPEWDMAAVNAGLPIGNLEQDFFVEQAKEGPQIVDSAGNVGNFVNGEFVVDTGVTPNLSYAATGAPAPSPRAPAPAPTPASSGFDPALLFMLGAMMTPQEQKQQEEQMAPARAVASPFGMDLLL